MPALWSWLGEQLEIVWYNMQGKDMMDPPAHVQGSPRGGSSALAPLELGAVCTQPNRTSRACGLNLGFLAVFGREL